MPGVRIFGPCAVHLGTVSYRTLLTLVANAVAWAMLLSNPWTQLLGPAPIALAVIHVAYPLIAASRTTPLLVAAVDAAALYAAYRYDVWGELTIVVVPLLGAIAFIALAYAAIVVSLLHRPAKQKPDEKPEP